MMRVVKLGGSLLDWPLLAQQLRRWLNAQSPALNVLVVGGGELAEAVRRLDEIHQLTPHDAHWLAAETMQITAKFVAIQLSTAGRPASGRKHPHPGPFPEGEGDMAAFLGMKRFDELSATGKTTGVAIFDAWQFLCEVEPTLAGERLPESWDTTSDSIAARLAAAIDADELVLLKSALPRNSAATMSELAAQGYVDAALPRIASPLRRVRCVNLRDDGFAECDMRS